MIRDRVSRAKNLSAVTHISESVSVMPSDAETAEQAAAAKKRLEEQYSASLDVLMADAVGRDLLKARINPMMAVGRTPFPSRSSAPTARGATIARPTTSSHKMVS